MIATVVSIYVKPECVDDFIKETLKNHEGTIKEPGNLRFDFLRAKDDPCRFTLYEVFRTPEDIVRHKENDHYKIWRETVEPYMQKRREGLAHDVIAPLDEECFATL